MENITYVLTPQAQRLKASVPSDGTFTLESDVEQEEKNDTYTKEQVETRKRRELN